MKPLIVLLLVFCSSAGLSKIMYDEWNPVPCGNIAMCVMLCFTALGHFKFTEGMAMMVPTVIPFKKAAVVITGIVEIVLGLLLLFPAYRYMAGIALIIFLVMVLPANIGAAFKRVNFEEANYNGKGPEYLWLRIPMQLFFLAWVFYFTVNILP